MAPARCLMKLAAVSPIDSKSVVITVMSSNSFSTVSLKEIIPISNPGWKGAVLILLIRIARSDILLMVFGTFNDLYLYLNIPQR